MSIPICVLAAFVNAVALSCPKEDTKSPTLIVLITSPTEVPCKCNITQVTYSTNTIDMCSVAQACMEIDNIQLDETKGQCEDIQGVNCTQVSSQCKVKITADVIVHSVCCCGGTEPNGVNVWSTGNGCDFVGDGQTESIVAEGTAGCDPGTPSAEQTTRIVVSCEKTCTELERGASNIAQAWVEKTWKCAACGAQ